MNFKGFVILLIALAIDLSLACNGFKANIKRIENCGGADQVITIDPDFQVKLTKDCEIIPTGCVSSKAFKTAKVTYTVVKDGIPVKEGTGDLCEAASSATEEAKNMMKIFALPDHCPVEAGKICSTDKTKADLSKYKVMLGMAKGNIQIDANIEHDTGKSCFKAEIEITK